MDPEQNGSRADEAPEKPKKKPYRRPEILYRETLEVMAAVCTPAPPCKRDPGNCPQGPISS
jgi:hypothetical protein